MTIYDEIRAERERAHAKHGATSMESSSPSDPIGRRYRILSEEVGEVAKEFNDAESEQRPVDLALLRKELIQVAAMAAAWADTCSVAIPPQDPTPERHEPYDDDGVTYCGWIAGRRVVNGCGHVWPCPTVKIRDAALLVGERITDANGDELEHGTDSEDQRCPHDSMSGGATGIWRCDSCDHTEPATP